MWGSIIFCALEPYRLSADGAKIYFWEDDYSVRELHFSTHRT
jgi:hypothetical protein